MKLITWLKSLFTKPKLAGTLYQPRDSRDLKFSKEFKVGSYENKTIPSLYEWSKLPNQGRTNACVGFSISRLLEILIYQVVKEEDGDDYYMNVSELFTWYNARLLEGTQEDNVGVIPRDAFKVLFSNGYLPYESFPFNNDYKKTPEIFDYAVAITTRDMLLNMKFKYYAVSRRDGLKLSNKGQAVGVALPMNSSWVYNKYTKDLDKTGGYHYMVLEGTITHNNIEYCKFANSWGKGYLYVPVTYYNKHAVSLWTLAKK